MRRGLGKGTGPDYKGYLDTRDVHSEGTTVIVNCPMTGTQKTFFSLIEADLYFLCEWSDRVVDVLEQYPLPLQQTIEVAKALGVSHPYDTKFREPRALTTDLVIIEEVNGVLKRFPRAVKPATALNDERVWQLLDIERLTWDGMPRETHGAWRIVTERDIPRMLVRNIKWVRDLWRSDRLTVPLDVVASVAEDLNGEIADYYGPYWNLCRECDARHDLEPGTSILVVRHLLARKLWLTDMTQDFRRTGALKLTHVASDLVEEVLRGTAT